MTKKGYFGKYGGQFVPELLITPLQELADTWNTLKHTPSFLEEFHSLLTEYAGRETPLTRADRFSKAIDGPIIYLKREDLLHTGAHKINNTLGQCLLAKKMGKKRIIAETGAGQHGVATATACAYFDLECIVYMGKKDATRQEPNVKQMQLLGATVIQVGDESATLKEAINEAMRDYAKSYEHSHYCLGSALGPYPYPEMVAHFQSVIGKEIKRQMIQLIGKNPDYIIACVGGGSNAIGAFSSFIHDTEVTLIGVEAGGSSNDLGKHAARFSGGSPGVLHGAYSYLLQTDSGQIAVTSSISAGMDYPSVGPAHAELFDQKRASYEKVSDKEALNAFKLLAKTEGIIPALESSHALAYVSKIAKTLPKDKVIVINLSGRGNKDLPQLFQNFEKEILS